MGLQVNGSRIMSVCYKAPPSVPCYTLCLLMNSPKLSSPIPNYSYRRRKNQLDTLRRRHRPDSEIARSMQRMLDFCTQFAQGKTLPLGDSKVRNPPVQIPVPRLPLTLQNEPLKISAKFKYLGIFFVKEASILRRASSGYATQWIRLEEHCWQSA